MLQHFQKTWQNLIFSKWLLLENAIPPSGQSMESLLLKHQCIKWIVLPTYTCPWAKGFPKIVCIHGKIRHLPGLSWQGFHPYHCLNHLSNLSYDLEQKFQPLFEFQFVVGQQPPLVVKIFCKISSSSSELLNWHWSSLAKVRLEQVYLFEIPSSLSIIFVPTSSDSKQ